MKDPKDPSAGGEQPKIAKTILAHGQQNQQAELRQKQQQYRQQQQQQQQHQQHPHGRAPSQPLTPQQAASGGHVQNPQHPHERAPSQPLTPQQAASGGHVQNPQHPHGRAPSQPLAPQQAASGGYVQSPQQASSPWQGHPAASYAGPGGGRKNQKLILAGVGGLALVGVIGIVVASQSCGGDKEDENKTALGVTKPEGDGEVTSNKRMAEKPFDVSLEETFTNGDFTYKVTKLRVSRSISSLARASDGARYLTIKFEQQNNANEMRKVNWFRDFELRSSDGKKFTASKVGSEALLIRKRGLNYREAEVQSGVKFEGGTAFEVPLPVLDDHKLLFIFKHAQGNGETRVLLQKPDIANWVLVEPYLRPALLDPTPANVKKVMGKTDESDSAVAAYANSLQQYMNAFTTERDEWRARKRSLKNLEEISSEQEGDRLTVTRFLKKRGKASERPRLKLVTTATKQGTYVLTSVALSFGKN